MAPRGTKRGTAVVGAAAGAAPVGEGEGGEGEGPSRRSSRVKTPSSKNDAEEVSDARLCWGALSVGNLPHPARASCHGARKSLLHEGHFFVGAIARRSVAYHDSAHHESRCSQVVATIAVQLHIPSKWDISRGSACQIFDFREAIRPGTYPGNLAAAQCFIWRGAGG